MWKVSKYGVFSGPCFPVFGLDTEIYWNLRIQSEYRKIRTRKNSVSGHISRSGIHHSSFQYHRNKWHWKQRSCTWVHVQAITLIIYLTRLKTILILIGDVKTIFRLHNTSFHYNKTVCKYSCIQILWNLLDSRDIEVRIWVKYRRLAVSSVANILKVGLLLELIYVLSWKQELWNHLNHFDKNDFY